MLGAKPYLGKMQKSNIFTQIIDVPAEFDAREKWTECSSIRTIRDQGHCGACWAISTVEAFTDRYCIIKKGNENPSFSAQYLLTCDDYDGGCIGGSSYGAWEFVNEVGVVTEGCQPYNISTCPPQQEPCDPNNDVPTPKCIQSCYGTETSNRHYRVGYPYQFGIPNLLPKIQGSIYGDGPVTASFDVYDDFIHYKTGIYQKTAGAKKLGSHAVKLIGWGEENGTDYWLVANSWTTTWGENGFFRIQKGVNECGIEDAVNTATPKG